MRASLAMTTQPLEWLVLTLEWLVLTMVGADH
jgi:hypothetical protein